MPSFDEAQVVYSSVPNIIPLGAWNKARHSTYSPLMMTGYLLREMNTKFALHVRLFLDADVQGMKAFYAPGSSAIKEELDNALISILCEYFKVGNCGEQAAIAFTQFLTATFTGRLEYVEIHSKGYREGHSFLVLNRDEQSDLQTPATWGKNAILFDTWAEELIALRDSIPLSMNDIARMGNVPGDTFILHTRSDIKGPLTPDFFTTIVRFLEALKLFLTDYGSRMLERVCDDADIDFVKSDSAITDMIKITDAKIAHFKQEAQHAATLAMKKAADEKPIQRMLGNGVRFTLLQGLAAKINVGVPVINSPRPSLPEKHFFI